MTMDKTAVLALMFRFWPIPDDDRHTTKFIGTHISKGATDK